MVLHELLIFLLQYQSLTSLIGSFIGGEETILFLAFLVGQGIIRLWVVFVFSFLGILISDSLWYFVGRFRLFRGLRRYYYVDSTYKKITEFLDKKTRGNYFLALLLTKFIYGVRVIVMVYTGRKGMSYKRFLAYSSVVILIWLSVLFPLGFLAGRGLGHSLNLFKNFERLLLIMVLIWSVIHVVKKIINKAIILRIEKSN